MKKFLIVYFLFASSFVQADTIQLKSGEIVEGEIISQNEDEVKINFSGTQVTYFMEDVEEISTIYFKFHQTHLNTNWFMNSGMLYFGILSEPFNYPC